MGKEKRVDSLDGNAYTWAEISAFYDGKYKKWEIVAYWEALRPAPHQPIAKVKAKAKPKPKAKQLPEPTENWFGVDEGLFAQYFTTRGKARGGVVISTGVHQHCAMYEVFAKRLVAEGFAVLAYDHRGFGRSKSYKHHERSQIPEWHSLEEASAVRDLKDAIELLGTLARTKKVFVFGHSLGGLVAALLATAGIEPCPAAGFILSNPSLTNPWAGTEGKQKEIEALDPNDSPMGFDADGASNCVAFKELWASFEPTIIESGRPFKAAYLLGIFREGGCMPVLRSRFDRFTSPAYIIRGGEDIAVYEQNGCADLIRGASKDAPLTLVSYPKCKHEIIFEQGMSMTPGANVVVDGIVAWLKLQKKLQNAS